MTGDIFHITSKTSWSAARRTGRYLAESLAGEGFIHCSKADQILRVANSFYGGQMGLVILEINLAKLSSKVAWEPGTDKADELFPHIYGPVNLEAVTRRVRFRARPGREVSPSCGTGCEHSLNMVQFFLWYLLVTCLGWLTFPLAFRLFPALADRGFSLARAFGMLGWGYAFWVMTSLGIIQNNVSGLLVGLVVLGGVSAATLLHKEARRTLGDWIGSNVRLVVTVEILFLLAFAFLAFVRAGNPEIAGTEKPMELAFINAILHSPTFPPHDPWLSGYAISYYYFGYVMTAMLAMVTGTLGSVAFNLMLALIFALSAVGAYGLVYDLLAAWGKDHPISFQPRPITAIPLLGPLFLLVVSNFEGFLEVLHRCGLFWKFGADGTATSVFWKWLDLQDLRDPPNIPLGWLPQRFYWWWRASRVITEYNLAQVWHEIIDEFPFFSYLLGDLHPHVLAMPFDLLVVGVALNLFTGGWKGETNLGVYKTHVHPAGLFFGALMLGGLAFLNTWDILSGFALLVGAYALARGLESGWTWKLLEDVFSLGVPLGLLAILLYLPFYLGFSSQAGGILPNLENPTRGAQLWIMFGPLFLAIFAWLLFLWRHEKHPANWKLGLGLAAALAIGLWIFSWLLGLLVRIKMPDFVASYLASEGISSLAQFFSRGIVQAFLIYRWFAHPAGPAWHGASIPDKRNQGKASDRNHRNKYKPLDPIYPGSLDVHIIFDRPRFDPYPGARFCFSA